MNIFSSKLQNLPYQIVNRKPDITCPFFIKKRAEQINDSSNKQKQVTKVQIKLGIINDIVVEFQTNSQKILSWFQLDFSIKFNILRQPSISEIDLGKTIGISFEFTQSTQDRQFSFFLPNQKFNQKFNQFYSILSKKFIVQKQFHKQYRAVKRIGKGVTACVYKAVCIASKNNVAIKSFKKQEYFKQNQGNGKKAFLKQFKILTKIQCRYLIQFYGVYQSDNSIYIVTEILDRTLFNYLQIYSFPLISQCKKILYQLLMALRYLHKRNIMHRDLKLQNIMIRGSQKDDIQPVIIDLGLAEYQDSKDIIFLRCGTPGYVAPEVINFPKQQKILTYNKSCDIFSMGVIFHIMLLGKPVFQGTDVRLVIQANKECKIDYNFPRFPNLPQQLKDILGGMLRKQPQNRYAVQYLMNHEFFTDQIRYFKKQVQNIDKKLQDQIKLQENKYQQEIEQMNIYKHNFQNKQLRSVKIETSQIELKYK